MSTLEYGPVSGVDSVRLTENQEETIVREVASLLGEDARQTGVALGPCSRYRRIAKARLLSRLESQNAKGEPLWRRDEPYDDHS
jgi:hypothetical protein